MDDHYFWGAGITSLIYNTLENLITKTYNDATQPLFQKESKEEINSNHCLLKIDPYQSCRYVYARNLIIVILTKHYLHISILLLKALFVLCIVLQYYLFDPVLEDDKLPNY